MSLPVDKEESNKAGQQIVTPATSFSKPAPIKRRKNPAKRPQNEAYSQIHACLFMHNHYWPLLAQIRSVQSISEFLDGQPRASGGVFPYLGHYLSLASAQSR